MRAPWMIAIAASVALVGAAPDQLQAQGRSGQARAERGSQAQQERGRQAEQQRGRQAEQQRAQADRRESRAEQRVRDSERDRARQQSDRARQQRPAIGIMSRIDPRDARRNERDRYDDRGLWSTTNRGNGPAFCRSGEGHPVYGRQWCRDKGWALGNSRNARDSRDIDIWRDIILGRDRDRRRYDQTLSRSVLGDILGAVLVNRMESYGRQYGSGPMTGRWIQDSRANVLQLSMGGVPIARLVDSDGDGRLNDVLLRN